MPDADPAVAHFLNDLKTAPTLDFFDLRVALLRSKGVSLPPDLDRLRAACRQRHLEWLEAEIAGARHEDFRRLRRAELDRLRGVPGA